MKRSYWISLGALVLAQTGVCGAPPPPPPPDAGPGVSMHDRHGKQMEPQELRRRLQRRLEAAQQQQERLGQALAVLDEGGSVEKALSELRQHRSGRTLRGMGGGPPEEDRPDQARPRRGAVRVPGPPGSQELSREDWGRIETLVDAHMPELAAKLESLKATDPQAERMLRRRLGGVLLDIVQTRVSDEQAGDLKLAELKANVRVVEIAREVHNANAAGDEQRLSVLRGELTATLNAQFDARARLARLEIDRLREQLDNLLAETEQRELRRGDEIEARVERIMKRAARRGSKGRGGRRGPPDGG